MKYLKFTIYIIIFFTTIVVGGFASAQITNPLLNFAGKVTELDGSELADGVYDFRFEIFDSRLGGASLWSEDLNAGNLFSGNITGVVNTGSSVVYDYNIATCVASSTLRVGQYLTNGDGESVLIIDYDNDSVTVASGSPVWIVGDVINNRPFVSGGVIDINMGAVSSLASVDFDQELYLEVTFNGEVMQPRKVLSSVNNAIFANVAGQLAGYSASDFGLLSDDEVVSGEWDFLNVLNVATSSSNTVLTVTQNGSGNIVEFRRGTTTALAVLGDGRVQIGNYVFPATYGNAGYTLKSNGAGLLYWDLDISGGGDSGLWATSSNNQFLRLTDVGDLVVIGDVATSSLGNFNLYVNGDALFSDVNLQNHSVLRFYDSDNSNYLDLRASGTIASNFTLTLPADAGTNGLALVTDGAGNLRWDNVNGSYEQVKTVAKSGGDYVTIQEAIDALTCSIVAPCVVRVMPGVYDEQVVINNKSYINIISTGGPEVTKISPAGVSEAVVISGTSGNVRVEGFGIEINN